MLRILKIPTRNPSRLILRELSSETEAELLGVTPKKLSWMKKMFCGTMAVGTGVVAYGYYLERTVHDAKAEDLVAHPHQMPWFHVESVWHGYDIRSVRRGYQVYKQVCAACHNIEVYKYRHFVGRIFTEKEAKAEAADTMVEDGPNEEGKMFMRPGILNDEMPRPYANEMQAKLANNMAIPPPLEYIALARHGGEEYLFHLLTSYYEAPAGITVAAGQAYNPYFPNGSVLSMAQQLYDDMITYEDGTPATQSQMAKDVTNFLSFIAKPYQDERKKSAIKLFFTTVPLFFILLYYKRFIFTSLKSQKFLFRSIKGREAPKKDMKNL